MSKPILFLAAAMASAAPACAQPVSGSYGPLHLVVHEGRVGGVYLERRGQAMHCAFLIEGREGVAKVDAWVPRSPRGPATLRPAEAGVTFQIDFTPIDCTAISEEPQHWPRSRTGENWINVAQLKAEAATLHAAPGGDPVATLALWDAVAVLERRGEWLRVERLDDGAPATGWMRAGDVVVAIRPDRWLKDPATDGAGE